MSANCCKRKYLLNGHVGMLPFYEMKKMSDRLQAKAEVSMQTCLTGLPRFVQL